MVLRALRTALHMDLLQPEREPVFQHPDGVHPKTEE